MSRLILASASTSRAKILRNAGVDFTVEPAHVDEDAVKDSMRAAKQSHRAVADALAELKAQRVSSQYPQDFVIGADQVLSFNGWLVSKCTTMAEARNLLSELRGKSHELLSAVVLAKGGSVIWRHVEKATLTVREFSGEFLDHYLETNGESLLSGVGCYRLEGDGAQLFAKMDGDYFAILGLPLIPLLSALREQGVIPA
ncbi:MAG TPA: Maf family nucleotide pyrophosphatase [Rhizomicrobium sp.]|nr:Maf family nucleotide pyrophosphatase [Rhizomicrobium sp.]